MTWWRPEVFADKRAFLKARAGVLRAVRAFFDAQGFLEADVPLLQPCPTMDTHIHGFAVPEANDGQGAYLHASPEFHMKKLLVAGCKRIYCLGPVFRREVAGAWHSPEFTMLEWYRSGSDYNSLIADCRGLLTVVAPRYGNCDPSAKWGIMTVHQAFENYAKIDLSDILDDTDRFSNAARGAGVRVRDGDDWGDIFDAVMADKIEPRLGQKAPTVLKNYPARLAALARLKPGDPRWAERAELYVTGTELANGFSELTEAAEQRARFDADRAEKQTRYGFSYTPDADFLKALEHGMPESAGMALGIDRLVMLATGARHIDQVRWG